MDLTRSTGSFRRVLILDCDDTLWGGVVGEVGIEGIQLDPDSTPGRYFMAFQESVLRLMSQGVDIALNSKNDAEDVLNVLDNHPHCLIKRHHLSALRVNWHDKASNVRELVEVLEAGPEECVFVDDSEDECRVVREAFPLVKVVQVPANLESLKGILFQDGLFSQLEESD